MHCIRYYKEELGGDKENYIYMVAAYNGGNISTTLKTNAENVIASSRRIESILKGKGMYEKVWHIIAAECIHWYLTQARYRLS
jgi:hypothetical protein